MATGYWLMKSEPETYSIQDLASQPNKTDFWDGVRNYQARNFMRDDMRVGDLAFFYHSNCKIPAIMGIAKIVKEGYPDDTALDPESKYYDPKSTPDNPRWFRVDIQLQRILDTPIALTDLKTHPGLEDFPLVRKGNRLSVMPVTKTQWNIILKDFT